MQCPVRPSEQASSSSTVKEFLLDSELGVGGAWGDAARLATCPRLFSTGEGALYARTLRDALRRTILQRKHPGIWQVVRDLVGERVAKEIMDSALEDALLQTRYFLLSTQYLELILE